uniref:Putative thaumatin-like protein 1b-like n=1 Tax=Solanum chacoense TaxID=4108 RepID=A0A0V0HA36_SOLCH
MKAYYFSVVVIFSLFFIYGCYATKLLIKNNCPHKIWPATQSGTDEGAAIPTGFRLASRGTKKFNLPNPWSGRIWARHLCSYSGQNFTCLSGDCRSGSIECDGAGGTPPATLVQFTIANTSNEKDFYSVSIVDGFNLPVSVTPINRPDCGIADCLVNLKDAHCGNQVELEVRDQNETVIGCKSGCSAFNRDDLCCTGAYNSPQTCKPSIYSLTLKKLCDKAITYPYDDETLFTCSGGANYKITFCPWGQE